MLQRRMILYGLETLALVVQAPTGVSYLNQVGGNLCSQAEIEGALFPLEEGGELMEALRGLSFPRLSVGIGTELAEEIDTIISRSNDCVMRVDRDLLDESCEAWIHVLVDSPGEQRSREEAVRSAARDGRIQGFGPARGVLTWPNSD